MAVCVWADEVCTLYVCMSGGSIDGVEKDEKRKERKGKKEGRKEGREDRNVETVGGLFVSVVKCKCRCKCEINESIVLCLLLLSLGVWIGGKPGRE